MKHELSIPEQFATEEQEGAPAEAVGTDKKAFVEPEISAAVDVLAATTFFNASTSGAAN